MRVRRKKWDLPVWDIPNFKNNHIEKTFHSCQFPVALVDRFVLSLTPSFGFVFDLSLERAFAV